MKRNLKKDIRHYSYLMPALLLIGGIIYYPILNTLFMSFTDKVGFEPASFIWFKNYKNLLIDPIFHEVVLQTLYWTFGIIFFTMSISFYLAYFLSKDFYAKKIVRTVLILPWATSMVITATAYKLILNGQYGFLNKVLYDFNSNFRNIAWLGNVRAVMPCLIFIGIMVSIPFATLALMAAFQGIPQEILEAADIDGASAWKKLIHIMIPYIKPTIGVVMLVNIIYDFNSFPIIWVLTKGGPVYKTHILVTYLYEKAFFFMEFGSASSIAIIVFIIIFILSFLYVRLFHRKEGTI
ncbi:MAG: sugar ABC transporter permease [Spirochaetes bacterium]|nr:sugar ABC transporter permease [Spirochaetota bacterium]